MLLTPGNYEFLDYYFNEWPKGDNSSSAQYWSNSGKSLFLDCHLLLYNQIDAELKTNIINLYADKIVNRLYKFYALAKDHLSIDEDNLKQFIRDFLKKPQNAHDMIKAIVPGSEGVINVLEPCLETSFEQIILINRSSNFQSVASGAQLKKALQIYNAHMLVLRKWVKANAPNRREAISAHNQQMKRYGLSGIVIFLVAFFIASEAFDVSNLYSFLISAICLAPIIKSYNSFGENIQNTLYQLAGSTIELTFVRISDKQLANRHILENANAISSDAGPSSSRGARKKSAASAFEPALSPPMADTIKPVLAAPSRIHVDCEIAVTIHPATSKSKLPQLLEQDPKISKEKQPKRRHLMIQEQEHEQLVTNTIGELPRPLPKDFNEKFLHLKGEDIVQTGINAFAIWDENAIKASPDYNERDHEERYNALRKVFLQSLERDRGTAKKGDSGMKHLGNGFFEIKKPSMDARVYSNPEDTYHDIHGRQAIVFSKYTPHH